MDRCHMTSKAPTMPSLKQYAKAFLLAVCALSLLTACGWHLRGSEGLPDNLKALNFDTHNSNSPLSRDIQRTLHQYDIDLQSSEANVYALKLLQERESKRVVSLSVDALANEYELLSEARFTVIDGEGRAVINQGLAQVTRVYEHDPDDALSKSEEESLVRDEMRADLVRQIIQRLRFIAAKR